MSPPRASVSVAAIAVAWVLAQGKDIVPLVGARKRAQWAELSEADGIVLSEADLAAIEQAVPAGAAKGDRYPPRRWPISTARGGAERTPAARHCEPKAKQSKRAAGPWIASSLRFSQ